MKFMKFDLKWKMTFFSYACSEVLKTLDTIETSKSFSKGAFNMKVFFWKKSF